jgi:hypothetical protein
MLPAALFLHALLEISAGLVGYFDPEKVIPQYHALPAMDKPWINMIFLSIISNGLAALIVVWKAPKSNLKILSLGFTFYHAFIVVDTLVHGTAFNEMQSLFIAHLIQLILFIVGYLTFKQPAKSKVVFKLSKLTTAGLFAHFLVEFIFGSVFYFITAPSDMFASYTSNKQLFRILFITMITQGVIALTVITRRKVVYAKAISIGLLAYHILVVLDNIFGAFAADFPGRVSTVVVHTIPIALFVGGFFTK